MSTEADFSTELPTPVEDYEHAMDALFAGLHSSHVAVREGLVTDPSRFTADDFRPTCGRCGLESEPGTRRCACGCWLVL